MRYTAQEALEVYKASVDGNETIHMFQIGDEFAFAKKFREHYSITLCSKEGKRSTLRGRFTEVQMRSWVSQRGARELGTLEFNIELRETSNPFPSPEQQKQKYKDKYKPSEDDYKQTLECLTKVLLGPYHKTHRFGPWSGLRSDCMDRFIPMLEEAGWRVEITEEEYDDHGYKSMRNVVYLHDKNLVEEDD